MFNTIYNNKVELYMKEVQLKKVCTFKYLEVSLRLAGEQQKFALGLHGQVHQYLAQPPSSKWFAAEDWMYKSAVWMWDLGIEANLEAIVFKNLSYAI